MVKRLWLWTALALMIGVAAGTATLQPALACGGFFCLNSPVDQNAERIIFTQNRDGTISAYVQIQYTGSAAEFSWILPVPVPLAADDIEVPDDAMAAFTELEVATDPVFIPPPMPQCAEDAMRTMFSAAAGPESAGVQVFSSGEVGPYGFDVIGSEDPDALINWLREHNYRVTEDMEPLINLYVEEHFAFLAMRLLPDKDAQDVQPIKITYPSQRPMIPLRLTAVAANPDMAVMVWIYADTQAVPANYAELEIADEELTFFGFGGNSNYRQLMGERADEYGGQGFITEYAAPTRELAVSHPILQELSGRYPYVTRLNTVISPEEMTVDPIFDYDPQRKDVSNIHDLSNMTGLFDCERQASTVSNTSSGNNSSSTGSVGPGTSTNPPSPTTAPERNVVVDDVGSPTNESRVIPLESALTAGAIGAGLVMLAVVLVLAGVLLGRRVRA